MFCSLYIILIRSIKLKQPELESSDQIFSPENLSRTALLAWINQSRRDFLPRKTRRCIRRLVWTRPATSLVVLFSPAETTP